MKRFNITRAKKYTDKQGEEKKQWLQVGTIVQFDDGGLKLELNHTDTEYAVFEQKPRNIQSEPKVAEKPVEQQIISTSQLSAEVQMPEQHEKASDVKVEDIPF